MASFYVDTDCDYMPPYPWVLGRMQQMFARAPEATLPEWTLKLPGILGDLATAAFLLCFGVAVGRPVAGQLMAAVHFLNPAVIVGSALWGQIDVWHSLFMTMSIAFAFLATSGGPILRDFAFGALALATMVKIQAGILWPWLLVISSVPGRRLTGLPRGLLFAAGVAALVLLPILMAGELQRFFEQVVLSAPGRFDRLSMKAFNAWWLLPREWRRGTPDTVAVFPGVSLRTIGIVLFGLAVVFALVRSRHRSPANPARFFAIPGFIALAFFMLPTEMHERYLLQVLPILALGVLMGGRWYAYGFFSATCASNLLLVLMRHWLRPERATPVWPSDPGAGFSWSVVVAAANAIGFLCFAFWLARKPSSGSPRQPVRRAQDGR